ncbi:alpha/beta hydrolase family protein [Streptomyces zhihengii]
MIRGRKAWATATAVLTVMAAAPAVAHAAPAAPDTRTATSAQGSADGLPPGWRITGEGGASHLEWRSPRPVPHGDARVEFRANGALLGVPEPQDDNRTFRLPLDGVSAADLDGLRVEAAGRRLDAAAGTGKHRAVKPAIVRLPPLQPAGAVDPGTKGLYATTTGEYDLPSVRLPGMPEPVEMRGLVVAPKDATGERPVALFLHGRHATCYVPGKGGDEVTIDWPCAKGAQPIPSHKGYLRDQQLLASQGYVTVSISANGINGQDAAVEDAGAQARSSLVRGHLARWADWAADPASAPAALRKTPKPDLSRVLLVGHSRGGEGVNRAAMDSLYPPPPAQDGAPGDARWTIRGTVLIGPTIFGQNPVADVPSLTVLPGCDGDVSDLQGQVYADGTRGVSRGKALHSSVYVVGANHNYFNSEWTPGQAAAPADDDFWHDPQAPDPLCSPGRAGRLTADQQHRAGATYIAAAARLFVDGDDRVRELLDGTGRRAPSADPARVLTHAVGGDRSAGFLPDDPLKVSGARLCDAVAPGGSACLGEGVVGSSPHFAYWRPEHEAGRRAIALAWTAPGTPARVTPEKPLSAKGATSLALRLAVPPNSRGTQFDVAVKDASGKRANLGRVRVDGLPGTDRTSSYWAQEVRVPLTAANAAKLDLAQVASLELVPVSRSGKAWLIDAWAWQPGTPAVEAAPLTRVDLGRLTVEEGDSGSRTYTVPVRTTGENTGTVRLYVIDPETGTTTDRLVQVGPGTAGIDVRVTVTGNTRYGWGTAHDVLVKAVRGTVVGADSGGVTATEDDPMPKVSLRPVAADVTEGKPLTWRISLSEPADVEIPVVAELTAVPDGRAELSSADVDQDWLRMLVEEIPNPAVPLSELDYRTLWTTVPAGDTTTELTVPTVRDRLREPVEYVRLQLIDDEGSPTGQPFEGTVRNAP